MVITVFGLPGSGKTYFAKRLALQLHADYINSDELRVSMFSNRTYTDAEKLVVYDAILQGMKRAVEKKKDVVLDATFYKKEVRQKFELAAKYLDAKMVYIEITADEEVISERLQKPRAFSEADYDVYLKVKAMAQPLNKDHLVLVSTNNNLSSMMEDALHYINSNR
jgi:predicted kinase